MENEEDERKDPNARVYTDFDSLVCQDVDKILSLIGLVIHQSLDFNNRYMESQRLAST